MTTDMLDGGFMVITYALLAAWAYAAVKVHRLATRPSRVGVRVAARRARRALIVAVFLVPAAAASSTGLWPGGPVPAAGPAVPATPPGPPPALLMLPLLVLPAAAVVAWSLPRLGRLIRVLYADPWGHSDPGIRDAAADPALAAPVYAAVAGIAVGTAAALAPYGAAAVALTGYAVFGLTTTAAWRILLARHRRVRAVRGGLPHRILAGRPAARPKPAVPAP